MRVTHLIAAFAVYGCGDALNVSVPDEPDLVRFIEDAEPELVAGCGNPSGCHGREDRPFTLYVRRANRLDPADVFIDPPLSEEESRANFERTVAFAVRVGDAAPLLLSKPLAPSAGGTWHRGGTIYESESERGYRVLADWLAGVAP